MPHVRCLALIAHAIVSLVTFVFHCSRENLRTSFKLGGLLFLSFFFFFFFLPDASNTSREITRCGVSVFAALCRESIHSSELKEIPAKKKRKKRKKRKKEKKQQQQQHCGAWHRAWRAKPAIILWKSAVATAVYVPCRRGGTLTRQQRNEQGRRHRATAYSYKYIIASTA